jgi:hypothetical protein
MGTIKVDFERSGVGRGIKIAAFVLILTAAALITDHMGVTHAPRQAVAQTAPAKPEASPAVAVDGFAVPDHLRPTQADVQENAPGF